VAALAVVVVVVVAYVVALVSTGSPLGGVLAWLLSVFLGLLLPGFAVVRAVRRSPAALIEDLSWGAAAGMVIALLGWFVDRVLPWSPGSLGWGLAVTALLLALPSTRPRVLARPAPGWGWRAAVGLALCHLVALAWMLSTALRGLPPRPGPAGYYYIHDVVFELAMTGELQHSVVPTYPMVSGQPLSYHWFIYAIQAHLIASPGVDRIDAVFRLMPCLLVPVLISLAAVVARQIAGRVAAGVLAAALLGVVGNSLPTRWVVPTGIPTRWNADGGSLESLTVYWQDSPPQALGWVAGVACLGLAIAFIRRAPEDRIAPTWLLVPFLVLAAGAKSSELPVLAAGVALAVLVALVLRNWVQARRAGVVLLGSVVVFGIALVTIYAAGSYGLILWPWGRLVVVVSQLTVGVIGHHAPAGGPTITAPTTAMIAAGIVYLLPNLPRVIGLGLLAKARAAEPALWIPLGTLLGGLGATLLFRHPSDAEVFFLVSAYPVALVGSAAGFVLGLEPAWRRMSAWSRPGAVTVLAGGAVVGFGVTAVVAYRHPLASPRPVWVAEAARSKAAGAKGRPTVSGREQLWTWLQPHAQLWAGVAVAVVLLAALTVVVRLIGRQAARRMPWSVVSLGLVAAVLGTGCFGTWLHVHRGDGVGERQAALAASAAAHRAGDLVTTPALIRAGDLVRRSSGPNDVVATNRYCLAALKTPAAAAGCFAEDFTVSAFTGRRVDVSGWAYATAALKNAWTSGISFNRSPFWDQARLNEENLAFTAPTADRLAELWRDRRVRWLVADLTAGPVDVSGLDQLADRRFSGSEIIVWQLRPPGPGPGG
jgi:hypothetical protein